MRLRENPSIFVSRVPRTAGILPASAAERESPRIFVGRDSRTAGILPAPVAKREPPSIFVARVPRAAGILPASAAKRESPRIFVGRSFNRDMNLVASIRLQPLTHRMRRSHAHPHRSGLYLQPAVKK